MELAFVFSALKRRVWVIVFFAFIGSVLGLVAIPTSPNTFESTAQLLIQPPSRVDNNTSFVGDPDRYVLGQLSVLESGATAAKAAEGLEGISDDEVAKVVEIEQEPKSDIVNVTVTANEKESAKTIAQVYVDSYIATLPQEDEAEAERLTAEEASIAAELDEVNGQLSEKMRRFVERGGTQPVPPSESVAPDLVSKRSILENKLGRVQMAQSDLIESKLRINTRVIQPASDGVSVPGSRGILLPGSVVGGLMLGVVVALLMARFSNKVQDEVSASQIMGVPIVGELGHYRSLAREHLAAFQQLPGEAIPSIDQLCVRAEAKAKINEPLSVAVVGTQRGAGATTLALAMSERFAGAGSSVVLVDADVRDPRVTALFHATVDGGIPAVIANEGALVDQRGRSVFTRTMDPEVRVLGLGPNRAVASLRRDTIGDVLGAASKQGEVVVVDGGPVLDLASTVQLTQLVDVVVLAVPLQRQKTYELSDMSRQLGVVKDKLFPVITHPTWRAPKDGPVVYEDPGGEGSNSGYQDQNSRAGASSSSPRTFK